MHGYGNDAEHVKVGCTKSGVLLDALMLILSFKDIIRLRFCALSMFPLASP